MNIKITMENEQTGQNITKTKELKAKNYLEYRSLLYNAESFDSTNLKSGLRLNDENFYKRMPFYDQRKKEHEEFLRNIDFINLSSRDKIKVPNFVQPHQKRAAETILSLPYGGLLADQVGMGKTIEAGIIITELAVRDEWRTLLITTSGENVELLENWQSELFNKFFLTTAILDKKKEDKIYDIDFLFDALIYYHETGRIYDNEKCENAYEKLSKEDGNKILSDPVYKKEFEQAKKSLPYKGIIVPYEVLSNPEFLEKLDAYNKKQSAKSRFHMDLIVVDESHRFSSIDGENTQLDALKHLQRYKKDANNKEIKDGRIILLTATPIKSDLKELLHLMQIINPEYTDEKFQKDLDLAPNEYELSKLFEDGEAGAKKWWLWFAQFGERHTRVSTNTSTGIGKEKYIMLDEDKYKKGYGMMFKLVEGLRWKKKHSHSYYFDETNTKIEHSRPGRIVQAWKDYAKNTQYEQLHDKYQTTGAELRGEKTAETIQYKSCYKNKKYDLDNVFNVKNFPLKPFMESIERFINKMEKDKPNEYLTLKKDDIIRIYCGSLCNIYNIENKNQVIDIALSYMKKQNKEELSSKIKEYYKISDDKLNTFLNQKDKLSIDEVLDFIMNSFGNVNALEFEIFLFLIANLKNDEKMISNHTLEKYLTEKKVSIDFIQNFNDFMSHTLKEKLDAEDEKNLMDSTSLKDNKKRETFIKNSYDWYMNTFLPSDKTYIALDNEVNNGIAEKKIIEKVVYFFLDRFIYNQPKYRNIIASQLEGYKNLLIPESAVPFNNHPVTPMTVGANLTFLLCAEDLFLELAKIKQLGRVINQIIEETKEAKTSCTDEKRKFIEKDLEKEIVNYKAINDYIDGRLKNDKILIFCKNDAERRRLDNYKYLWDFYSRYMNVEKITQVRNITEHHKEHDSFEHIIAIAYQVNEEGVNLQNFHHMIHYSIPLSPMKMEQRNGRIDRIGQRNDMEFYFFASAQELEGCMLYFLEEKLDFFNDFCGDTTASVYYEEQIDEKTKVPRAFESICEERWKENKSKGFEESIRSLMPIFVNVGNRIIDLMNLMPQLEEVTFTGDGRD